MAEIYLHPVHKGEWAKHCPKCDATYLRFRPEAFANDFYPSKHTKNKLSTWCKRCTDADNQERRRQKQNSAAIKRHNARVGPEKPVKRDANGVLQLEVGHDPFWDTPFYTADHKKRPEVIGAASNWCREAPDLGDSGPPKAPKSRRGQGIKKKRAKRAENRHV